MARSAFVPGVALRAFGLGAALIAAALSGCVANASLDGRPCPCESGYLCCLPTGRCVPAESCTPGDVNACAPAPAANGQMIANMEANSTDVMGGGVKGSWFTYTDNDAGVGTVSRLPEELPTPVCGSSAALHVQARGFSRWGSGIGFALSATDDKPAHFDATRHTGLRFWLKSARVPGVPGETQATHLDVYDDQNADAVTGCALADDCLNLFSLDTPVEATWKYYSVPFSALTDAAHLHRDRLYTIQWTLPAMNPMTSYDFWLDDVAWLDATR